MGLLLLCIALALQTPPASPQRKYPVLKLRPAAFPELPANLAAELDRRGCRVPQPDTSRRQNVIRGQFATPGQTDWAVLCSMNGFSRILVFWNGSQSDIAEIAKWLDPPLTVIYDHVIR